MNQLNRRDFIKLGGAGVAAGVASLTPSSALAKSEAYNPGATTLPYPQTAVAKAQSLPQNKVVHFNYPDESSPCVVIRMGHPVPGGVGPNMDIVAYSTLCTHMGCPVSYDPASRDFKCPCHFSVFDSEKMGQMVTGQATENLPKIRLEYDTSTDSVTAVGVDGLIFGRQANIL
ncbi:arsenite oxidase small subunit [Amphritea atlantica]|uniref:Arsenite oxidase small subunit n=1 Tax=Amphritea atlantica TaxID=355243 RepID=A0A1H9FJ00_9GAMM|nr:arsenate reductase (azurin) small subunit [Amphritea atlantica]SEQ37328.1 arsenite oxidase small subunit [Amphritea atlantica]